VLGVAYNVNKLDNLNMGVTMEDNGNEEQSQDQSTYDDSEKMANFDKTIVEPLNFTRQSLADDECLSYL
jgi:hypothetical protein